MCDKARNEVERNSLGALIERAMKYHHEKTSKQNQLNV